MAFIVGVGVILAGLFSGPAIIIVVGLFFIVVGVRESRRILMQTASRLSIDPTSSNLIWEATWGHGDVLLTDITEINRSKRPGVYEIKRAPGRNIEFWLGTRDLAVTSFFDYLQHANPAVAMSELHDSRRPFWSGLPKRLRQ